MPGPERTHSKKTGRLSELTDANRRRARAEVKAGDLHSHKPAAGHTEVQL
jgi:hypothetical protein